MTACRGSGFMPLGSISPVNEVVNTITAVIFRDLEACRYEAMKEQWKHPQIQVDLSAMNMHRNPTVAKVRPTVS